MPVPPAPLSAGGIDIVYADNSLLVADKPAGMLCVPGRGIDKADCLARRMTAVWPDALIVHRLDMATSGLVLMARGPTAQRCLSIAFRDRRVDKRYVAVVAGLPSAERFEIDLPIGADWNERPRRKIDHEQGKASLTRVRVLAFDTVRGFSRVELEPVTGRTHQLRLHLSAIGHPIVGDPLYAPPALAGAAPRLLLHAEHLSLAHPETGGMLNWHAAAPF